MKKLKVDRIVLVLFCTISLIILIRNIVSIFSRYQTEASSSGDVDIAFYFLTDNIQEANLNIDGIGAGESIEKTITISNNNGVIRSQTAMLIDINLTATTYLPLNYFFYEKKSDGSYILLDSTQNENVSDTISQSILDNLWYHYVSAKNLTLGCLEDETKEIKLVIQFPEKNFAANKVWGGELADLMESINLSVEAKQKITE